MTEQNRKDCDKILTHYGVTGQSLIACEEAGELIRAISKAKRQSGDSASVQNLISEMADVLIMMEQLKSIYAIMDSEIDDEINYKLVRQLGRIQA